VLLNKEADSTLSQLHLNSEFPFTV